MSINSIYTHLTTTSSSTIPSIPLTNDYGIQVDLNQNPENIEHNIHDDQNDESAEHKSNLTPADRRKLNKKLSKKRKRQKSQQMQREARRQIGNIIQQLYERTARFQDYAEKIQVLVQMVYNNDFRDYLDQLIRMRVTYIQKSIWEFTQSILYQNPFERNEDHAFYGQMIDQIYQRFLQIEESSGQIEKIINIYLKFAYKKSESKEEIIYNNLAVNTFNYMIETDQTLKNLLRICDKKVTTDRPLQRKKLEELVSIIDSYYEDYKEDYDQNSTSCANDQLRSTGHSEDDQILQKKRRRRKVKENDLIANEDSLVHRMQSLVVKESQRVPCSVSEEWLGKLAARKAKYLSNE